MPACIQAQNCYVLCVVQGISEEWRRFAKAFVFAIIILAPLQSIIFDTHLETT